MNPVIKSLIRFLYPAQCHLCEENLDPLDRYICKFCWNRTEYIDKPVCQTCGYPLAYAENSGTERPKDVWFRKSRSIANYYEHDEIIFVEYDEENEPKNSCSRCPRDVKPIFSLELDFHNDLDKGVPAILESIGKLKGRASRRISSTFKEHNAPLSSRAFIMVEKDSYGWRIKDGDQEYLLRREGERISVYGINIIPPLEKRVRGIPQTVSEKSISALSNAIHLLKYSGKTIMAEPLAMIMIKHIHLLLNVKDYDVIIPLPIHKKKLRQRGYNQVELIGRRLSKAVGIPLDIESLVKTIETESQAHSSFMKRGINLKGAFDVSERSRIEGKRVLLIDDVMTSGASVNESAKALVTKGRVKYVDVLTLVRAV